MNHMTMECQAMESLQKLKGKSEGIAAAMLCTREGLLLCGDSSCTVDSSALAGSAAGLDLFRRGAYEGDAITVLRVAPGFIVIRPLDDDLLLVVLARREAQLDTMLEAVNTYELGLQHELSS